MIVGQEAWDAWPDLDKKRAITVSRQTAKIGFLLLLSSSSNLADSLTTVFAQNSSILH